MESIINYYSGSHLNRLSWKRHSTTFLQSALISSKSQFILFKSLKPLTQIRLVDGFKLTTLAKFNWKTISNALGNPSTSEVIGHHGLIWPKKFTNQNHHLDLNGYPTFIFLGSDESNTDINALPIKLNNNDSDLLEHHTLGHPIWAIDVTNHSILSNEIKLQGNDQDKLSFLELKLQSFENSFDASISSQARSLIDWIQRNKFCSGCGRPNHVEFAGWKIICDGDDDDLESENLKRPICLTSKGGVQNFCYPRTDPVCIMAISHPSNDALLLGRKKNWPEGLYSLYSCLAGFVEPGESFEDSVRREVWEEAGVKVGKVKYHSTQPWPFPGSLMMGAVGESEENPKIRIDLDNELEDARFFPRTVIRKVMKNLEDIITLTKEEIEMMKVNENPPIPITGLKLRIPPPTAIAHQLIKSWAFIDIDQKPLINHDFCPNL
ncbi:hypothetical protein CROQUDRAFT_686895 [Cronartium quercuum f. sp. fusiforme G11]|uniref:NAD(+) diphosphatase n=1 Tax=Cronartium quercuum f. sp. fusiforme G11 TaxID=708437 RepID=A0A9P6NC82_9BASI|nr:hypothetical protein CROQUDRAFT_686895 [Cronartium quercuum f. sp. fusiforme G11]